MEGEEEYSDSLMVEDAGNDQVEEPTNCWNGISFAEKLKQKQQRPPIYTWKDEMDELDEAGLAFLEELMLEARTQHGGDQW